MSARRRKRTGVVRLTLPFPPSVNALWKRGKSGMYRSPRYVGWLNEAGKLLDAQRPGMVGGNYAIAIELERKDKRKRDADNFVKAVSDLLVNHGVIDDDSLAEAVIVMWSPTVTGCRVVVSSIEQQARAAA